MKLQDVVRVPLEEAISRISQNALREVPIRKSSPLCLWMGDLKPKNITTWYPDTEETGRGWFGIGYPYFSAKSLRKASRRYGATSVNSTG